MPNPNHFIRILLKLIGFYQKYISRLMAPRCRYYPTCSHYAITALKWHGVGGIVLSIKRVLSCHPFGGSGVDFVPVPMSFYCYYPAQYRHDFGFVDKYSYQKRLNFLLNCK